MRQQQTQQREVIYIMDPPKPPSNGMGIAGFVFGILGLFSFGILSPIGLLFSFFGMFKRPRGFAAIGMLMSLVGVAFLASVAVVPVVAERQHRAADLIRSQEESTRNTIRGVVDEIQQLMEHKRESNMDGFAGNAITIQYTDAWKNELRFDERTDGFAVRSAGRDQHFDTPDDIVQTYLKTKVNSDSYRSVTL